MTLGNLKKALAKFPPDMNDIEICLQVVRKDETQYEFLSFVGYAELPTSQAFMLGGESAAQELARIGQVKLPEGYVPSSPTGYHVGKSPRKSGDCQEETL